MPSHFFPYNKQELEPLRGDVTYSDYTAGTLLTDPNFDSASCRGMAQGAKGVEERVEEKSVKHFLRLVSPCHTQARSTWVVRHQTSPGQDPIRAHGPNPKLTGRAHLAPQKAGVLLLPEPLAATTFFTRS
jgi:hypothetical protein